MMLFWIAASYFSTVGAISPIWPMPSEISLGASNVIVDSSFSFKQISHSTLIDRAIDRYAQLLSVPSSSKGGLSSCTVESSNIAEDNLEPGVDESYELVIGTDGSCSIKSNSVWGSLYGMETFSQLLKRNTAENNVYCEHAPVAISDTPRFTHRGMMIDTSRHYLSLDTIRRIVDTLPASKFNVLHWHTVDAQSFPLDIPSEPTLVKGAYTSDNIYTMKDLSDISAYANDRGVRVVYEVDVPGHAAGWTKGKPEIMADCFAKYYYNINDFALNPTLDNTYTAVNNVIHDIASATKSKFFHTGGDEVVYGCWKNDSSITNWMNTQSMTSYDDLLGYFVKKVDDYIMNTLDMTPMHWEEVFTAGIVLDKRTIFQVWTSQTQIKEIVAAKYNVVASPSDVWYLDHAENKWNVMYNYDPTNNLTATESNYIVGGEVCMWSEHIDDMNIESIIYPRACAVGERLWSPSTVTDETDAHDRLLIQRCRLVQRGYRASPVDPGYCAATYV